MCVETPDQVYIPPLTGLKFGAPKLIFTVEVCKTKECPKTLKEQILSQVFRLHWSSKTKIYDSDGYNEDMLKPYMKEYQILVDSVSNIFNFKYIKNTLSSEESWLGIDLL